MRHTLRLNYLIVLIVIFLTSCGTMKVYDGPTRDESEIAVLITELPLNLLIIENIDGQIVLVRSVNRFELVPGKRRIGFGLFTGVIPGAPATPGYIEFQAEAGHSYVIKADVKNARLHAWITDRRSGLVVSGSPPD